MLSGLTVSERAFLTKYAEYRNGTKAALEVFKIKGKNPRKIASTMASQILKRDRVKEYLEGFITNEELVLQLKKGLHATKEIQLRDGSTMLVEDWTTTIKCLELIFKMKGYIHPKEEPRTERTGGIKVKFITHKVL